MRNERIDSAMAEQILQGDDTDPDILQSLGLELLAELKRCYRVIEDIESMIPDNHEEIDPVLSDILSECHRLLGM